MARFCSVDLAGKACAGFAFSRWRGLAVGRVGVAVLCLQGPHGFAFVWRRGLAWPLGVCVAVLCSVGLVAGPYGFAFAWRRELAGRWAALLVRLGRVRLDSADLVRSVFSVQLGIDRKAARSGWAWRRCRAQPSPVAPHGRVSSRVSGPGRLARSLLLAPQVLPGSASSWCGRSGLALPGGPNPVRPGWTDPRVACSARGPAADESPLRRGVCLVGRAGSGLPVGMLASVSSRLSVRHVFAM